MIAFRMLEPDGARLHNVSTSRVAPNGLWQFPIGAQSQTRQQQARIQRLEGFNSTSFQTHGLSAPRFTLEANFGSKAKQIDSIVYLPRELIQDFEGFIRYYFDARMQLMRERQPLIMLAFDDYVNDIHWIVVPDGMPQVRDNAREPLRPSFSISLNGVVELTETANMLQADTLPRDFNPTNQSSIKKQLTDYVEVI